jgi:hypothetical protein
MVELHISCEGSILIGDQRRFSADWNCTTRGIKGNGKLSERVAARDSAAEPSYVLRTLDVPSCRMAIPILSEGSDVASSYQLLACFERDVMV